jgi:hypothetical protein
MSASRPAGLPAEPDCPLCEAARITHWYFADGEVWVCDCEICATPMVVWWAHGMPDADTEARLLDRLRAVAANVYGADEFYIDGFRRNIPDHWHAHARPKGGFFGIGHPGRRVAPN